VTLTNSELFHIDRRLFTYVESDGRKYRYPVHYQDIDQMPEREQIHRELGTHRDSAMKLIQDQMPDAEFHVYGEGPAKESLIKLAENLGLSDRVIFHGLLPTEEIVKVMADTDLAVEPKRAGSQFGNEALSMKIFEFMAVGVPLVVSRTRIHQYYYSDSLVCYYEDDNDEQLAANILFLRNNSSRRKQQVSNSLQYVEAHNWGVEKSEYLRIVDSLVNKLSTLQGVPTASSPRPQGVLVSKGK